MKAELNMARRCVLAECEHDGGWSGSVISIDSTHVLLTSHESSNCSLMARMDEGVGADADVQTGGHGDGWPFAVGVVDAM